MKKALYYILFIAEMVFLSLLISCSGGKKASSFERHDENLMKHARLISMSDLDSVTTLVTVLNPWDTTQVASRYALMERGTQSKYDFPKGTIIIDVPVSNAIVYSGIHTSLLNELGRLDAVSGVCDTAYISDRPTLDAVRSGKIASCGRSTAPLLEKIISLKPQIVLLSPFETSNESQKYAKYGLNVVEASDYLEQTPLGRAEWIRFFGRLFGEKERGDSLFASIESEYLKLKKEAETSDFKPTVLFDRPYSGTWNVPTSGSVTGHLIADAGGSNPFSKYNNHGSAPLSVEEVLHSARNSDFWFIRYSEPTISLNTLAAENQAYTKFRAFQNRKVFVANTLTSSLFEDGAFHPEKVLREMIKILHPELDSSELQYYKSAH